MFYCEIMCDGLGPFVELVTAYCMKVKSTNFSNIVDMQLLLDSLCRTFSEFKSHEQIENKLIMRKLRSKIRNNEAVCNCHKVSFIFLPLFWKQFILTFLVEVCRHLYSSTDEFCKSQLNYRDFTDMSLTVETAFYWKKYAYVEVVESSSCMTTLWLIWFCCCFLGLHTSVSVAASVRH